MSSFQPQERAAAPPPCAAGCGFFGSPANQGMCSVCYKKQHGTVITDVPTASASATATDKPAPRSANPAVSAAPAAIVSFAPAKPVAEPAVPSSVSVPEAAAATKAQPSRCASCYKKVGLTGFVCRCGKTYCGRHRYAEEHGCAFDFKAAGRDAIARSNPLIKGEKLDGKI